MTPVWSILSDTRSYIRSAAKALDIRARFHRSHGTTADTASGIAVAQLQMDVDIRYGWRSAVRLKCKTKKLF